MTIEEKCQKLNPSVTSILVWRWFGHPVSNLREGDWENSPTNWIFCCKGNPFKIIVNAFIEIDGSIKRADDTECLTSQSHYIRGYKKWLMENE